MKKLGLCVCYNTYNYGSMLQVLATQKILDEENVDYEIIRYKKKKNIIFFIKMLPRIFNKMFITNIVKDFQRKINMYKYPAVKKNCMMRNEKFSGFIKTNFQKVSQIYYGYNELKNKAKIYDGFLVGSDQLWLPSGLGTNFYNLMFVPDYKTKISYATSFGVKNIPNYQKRKTKKFIDRIDFLSVRELEGKKIIQEISDKEVEVTLDPTLLFDSVQWNAIVPIKTIINEKYVLAYFLGENKEHRIISERIAKELGFILVSLPFLDNFVECDLRFGDRQLYNVGPDEFLNLIRNAEYVLTDSFHGTVFSILHHKRFMVFNRFDGESQNSRNSRIDNLCRVLDLESRRYTSENFEIQNEINYVKVDELLKKERDKSRRFIKEAIDAVKRG